MLHRISILFLNLFFPPLAVMIMTGLGSPETILNALLFILAVIPAHIHGFVVSWRYFHRKEKLEQHQWEGVRQQQQQKHNNRRKRTTRSNSSFSVESASSTSGRSDDCYYDDESGKPQQQRRQRQRQQRVWHGEVEEFSDREFCQPQPAMPPRRIQYYADQPYQRSIAGVPPPPCPSPPTQ